MASSGGVFEVAVDGTLIFSKKESGRFPSNEEILAALASRGPAGRPAP